MTCGSLIGMSEHEHGYAAQRAKYVSRVKRIEGQVRGIERMISEDKYCIDILTQISAITSALENVGLALLDDHLKHCVTDAIVDGHECDPGHSDCPRSNDTASAKVEEAMQAIRRMVKS